MKNHLFILVLTALSLFNYSCGEEEQVAAEFFTAQINGIEFIASEFSINKEVFSMNEFEIITGSDPNSGMLSIVVNEALIGNYDIPEECIAEFYFNGEGLWTSASGNLNITNFNLTTNLIEGNFDFEMTNIDDTTMTMSIENGAFSITKTN